MDTALLAARLLLAAIFAVAGLAKLRDFRGSRQSLIDFGVPDALAGAGAVLLPLAELACSIALLRNAWAWWGAAGVAALLAIFCLVIIDNLARGRQPNCHCFGQLKSSPVSGKTLRRNAVLLAIAVLLIAKGRSNPGLSIRSVWPSLAGLTKFESVMLLAGAALAVIAAMELWFLFHMLKQNGRLLRRVETLEQQAGVDPNAVSLPALRVGDTAPAFPGMEGIEAGRPVLLIFSSPHCGACTALKPEIARWETEHAARFAIVTISGRPEINDAYQVTAIPSAFLVEDGRIAAPLAEGTEKVRELVSRATLPPAAKKGDPVPPLKLKDLNGATVDLASLRGRKRLVLFWSPSCGFCQQMLDELKKWELDPPSEAPELVVVTSGGAEANRGQGFRSQVLLDPIFGAGNVLGADGTPSAVIIDEQGRVASEVGVGAPAVMAMAGSAK